MVQNWDEYPVLTKSLPIEVVRRCYAEEIRVASGLRSEALAEAFAAVPREDYLGPGPWQIHTPRGAVSTGTSDPRELYHDVLVAIDPGRQLNNGHPSSLAGWIDMLELSQGSHVFHVGCGTGYYTAIMAEVATSAGRVIAVEIDAGLAKRAAANLAHLQHVVVACADGISYDPGGAVDAILVNAGVTHLQSSWLERLSEGGRLLAPITVASPDLSVTTGSGQMLLVHRIENKYRAAFVSPVGIYSSPSGRDSDCNGVLARRFYERLTGKSADIQSVRVDPHVVDESCWLHNEGVCLSTLP